MKQVLLSLFLIANLCALSQNIAYRTEIEKIISRKNLNNSPISIYIAETNGKEVYRSNPQLLVTPASVLKLITTATALEVFSADFRYTTTIWARGEILNGKLEGDLIISGGGDPTLGSSHFNIEKDKSEFLKNWISAIKKAGIDTITGDIVADPFIYPDQDVPQSWAWEDMGNYYGAAAGGIALYDNTFTFIFSTSDTTGGPTSIIKTVPEIPNLQIVNNVISSTVKGDNAYVFGSPYENTRLIKGTLPIKSASFPVKASIPDPALLLAFELWKQLSDSLIIVEGKYKKEKTIPVEQIDSGKIILKWNSPDIKQIIEKTNFESSNLFAEHLCKQLGYRFYTDGTTLSGTKAMKEFWTKKGINTEVLYITDGSGLSRNNAATAKIIVDVLNYMRIKSTYNREFFHSIPLAGIDGTQQYYFQNSLLKGKARAKTGSMTRVRSMAGYLTTQNNKELSFAIILNNYNGSGKDASVIIEEIAELLYKSY
jgi:serine-type D-Ala-D-Ala carboxypeptidase/endopeptidase (penicillin-binding protein 4)